MAHPRVVFSATKLRLYTAPVRCLFGWTELSFLSRSSPGIPASNVDSTSREGDQRSHLILCSAAALPPLAVRPTAPHQVEVGGCRTVLHACQLTPPCSGATAVRSEPLLVPSHAHLCSHIPRSHWACVNTPDRLIPSLSRPLLMTCRSTH